MTWGWSPERVWEHFARSFPFRDGSLYFWGHHDNFSFWDVHDKRSAILDISRSFPMSQSFKGFYHNLACDTKAKTFSTGGPLYSITAECQLTLMDQHFEFLLMTPSVIQSLYYYGLLQYIIGCIM